MSINYHGKKPDPVTVYENGIVLMEWNGDGVTLEIRRRFKSQTRRGKNRSCALVIVIKASFYCHHWVYAYLTDEEIRNHISVSHFQLGNDLKFRKILQGASKHLTLRPPFGAGMRRWNQDMRCNQVGGLERKSHERAHTVLQAPKASWELSCCVCPLRLKQG